MQSGAPVEQLRIGEVEPDHRAERKVRRVRQIGVDQTRPARPRSRSRWAPTTRSGLPTRSPLSRVPPEFTGVHGEARIYGSAEASGVLRLELADVPQPRAGEHYEVWVLHRRPRRWKPSVSSSDGRTFSSNSLPPQYAAVESQSSPSRAPGALGHERGARSLRARDDVAAPGYNRASPGAIAQLGERLDRTQEVGSSSLPSSIA